MKKLIILIGACAMLAGCHPAADVNKKMDDAFEAQIGPSLDPTVATAVFYGSAGDLQKYWYGELTPLHLIIADRFRLGCIHLARLDSVVARIKTNDHDINEAIGNLREVVVDMQNLLKTSGHAQQVVIEDLASDGIKMPTYVTNSIDNLLEKINKRHWQLTDDLHNLEVNAISNRKLSIDDQNLVRIHLKQLVIDGINKRYKDDDKDVYDDIVRNVWEVYEKKYPVGATATN